MPWCHASYITKYTTLRPPIVTGRNDRGRLSGVTTTIRGLQRRSKSADVAAIRLVASHFAQTREFRADWMGRYLRRLALPEYAASAARKAAWPLIRAPMASIAASPAYHVTLRDCGGGPLRRFARPTLTVRQQSCVGIP